MKKVGIIFWTALLFSLLSACQSNSTGEKKYSYADYPTYSTAMDLVNSSDLVVQGIILDYRYEMIDPISKNNDTGIKRSEEAILYTIYTVSIADIYKGEYFEDEIEFKVIGGIDESGTENILEGIPEIKAGDELLLTLATFEDSYASLVNAEQSVYNTQVKTANSNSENAFTIQEIIAACKK